MYILLLAKLSHLTMSAKIKQIESLISEGKHTIALSKLVALRSTVEKGSLQYAQVLKLLGSLYYYYAEFTISMDFLKSALEVFQQHQAKEQVIKIEVNMALIYAQIKEYRKALTLINQILQYPNIENQVRWSVLLRKADIYHQQDKAEEGRKLYNLLLSEIPVTHSLHIQMLINSAINFSMNEQMEIASKQFSKAIELSTDLKQPRLLLYSNMNYASFLAKNNQEDEALEILHKCLEVVKENNVKISIRNISLNLANIYESKNQIEEANKHRNLATSIDLELKKERANFKNHLNN